MANGWTPARRARQSEAIRRWSPWKQATGPKTQSGKAGTSRNAFKGAHRAKLRADLANIRALMREIETEAFC